MSPAASGNLSDSPAAPTAAASDKRTAAVLFDMDGLLIDSEPLWSVAEVELANSLGGEFGPELKAAIVGTRLDVAVPTILRFYEAPDGPDDVHRAMDFLLARMVELYADELPVLPGVREIIAALRDREVPVGLVSSSYRVLVDAAVAQFPLGTFDLTLAGDEVTRGKPDPEPYVVACQVLGVPGSGVVVLEDAPSGVESAEAAGCIVVAVPSVASIPATPRRPAISSLADIDVDWLLSLPSTLATVDV